MRQFTVPTKYNQKRTDVFLFEMLPNTNASVIFKAFRKRSVRVNNRRVKESFLLSTDDNVQVYIPDEYLGLSSKSEPETIPEIIYEDEYIIVVSKPQGMPVHQDKNQEDIILDRLVQSYIRNRETATSIEDGFPALCHRIDRNTGGLVVLAKDADTLTLLQNKFRSHEIKKTYLCIVSGTPKNPQQELTGYLKKDRRQSRVFIYDEPAKNSVRIITHYRTLKASGQFSLLEVGLITGKTHQIRAHLAYIGHPILGDSKYGINAINKKYQLKHQALWAVNLTFDFKEHSGHLSYLNGKKIALSNINWEGSVRNLGLN